MSIRTLFLVFISFAIFCLCCQPPAQEIKISPLSAEDIAAIKALGPAMDQTALAGDWDALFTLMTEDVMLIMPNMAAIQGRDVCKSWVESMGMTITEHRIEFVEIDGCGGLAFARGSYAETVIYEGFEEPNEDVGKILTIVRKQSDGSWKIAIWMVNSELPPPEENADPDL